MWCCNPLITEKNFHIYLPLDATEISVAFLYLQESTEICPCGTMDSRLESPTKIVNFCGARYEWWEFNK